MNLHILCVLIYSNILQKKHSYHENKIILCTFRIFMSTVVCTLVRSQDSEKCETREAL